MECAVAYKSQMCKCALCFLVIPLQSVIATGWNDYGVELGAGYELVRTNANTVTIFEKDSERVVPSKTHDFCIDPFIVPPKIVGLNICEDIIVGKSESSPDADIPSIPGFFILNMTTGSVQVGLDEQGWLDVLKSLGITKKPSLIKPSRFFMWSLFIHRWVKSAVLASIVLILMIASYLQHSSRKRSSIPTPITPSSSPHSSLPHNHDSHH